jgi:FkbM family methyltransferase
MKFESIEMGGFTFFFPPNESNVEWSNANVIDGVINGGYYGGDLEGVVVDIGANVGSFSLLASRQAERVIAYEPDPRNIECLLKNIKTNKVKNIVVHRQAVGTPGTRTLNVNLINCGHSNLYFANDEKEQTEVESVSLAQVFDDNNLDRIDVLKVDCEGAEWEFLFEGEALLNRVERIVMEVHFYHKGQTLEAMKKFLSRRFKIQDIGQTTDTAFILRAYKK